MVTGGGKLTCDVIVIGSGAGGGTLTRALAEQGKKVLLLERGDWLPQEPANWDASEIFRNGRYRTTETWLDARSRPFTPGEYYNIGGKTRFYGSALFRMRLRDLVRWPLDTGALDKYYAQAEHLYHVHTLEHATVIQRIADGFATAGLHPEHAPAGVMEHCTRCSTCDGFACRILAKADAQTCGVQPALETGNVELRTNAKVTELIHSGGQVTAVLLAGGEFIYTNGKPVILAAGAVNSAALWLRSRLPDMSGQAGRNYMCHYSQAVLAIGREKLPQAFHKSLALFDWYDELGSVQMAGQPKAAMLRGESRLAALAPGFTLREIASRSVVFWLMTEDPPADYNRVTVSPEGKIRLTLIPGPLTQLRAIRLHEKLVKLLPGMGFHAHLRKVMPVEAVAHQCGTLKTGDSQETSVVNTDGRAWGTGNLYVSDASIFPVSSAVNPALTVCANALRLAEHLR